MATTDQALDNLLNSIESDFAQKIAQMRAIRSNDERFRVGAAFLSSFYGIDDNFFEAMRPR
jgi:hypothetical protein